MADLRAMADLACSQHDGNQEAHTLMMEWFRAWPKEYKALLPELVRRGLNDVIHESRHAHNRAAVGKLEVHPKGKETVCKVSPEARKRTSRSDGDGIPLMMDITLSGKRLGNCTKDELLEKATRERNMSVGALTWAVFFEDVAAGMKGKGTVSQQYSEKKLTKLYEAARRKAERKVA